MENGTKEQWVYAGLRVGSKTNGSKRLHAWREPGGSEYLYDDKGSMWVIGGIYDVEVDRTDAGVVRAAPSYTGERIEDRATIQRYRVADEAARIKLSQLAMTRADAKKDAIDSLLAPLREFSRTQLKTASEREAFAMMAMRAIYSA
jgi:hypothetical protein